MAVDHCFSIKGQGTVMTGTILSGAVSIGDNVEIPALKVSASHFYPKNEQGAHRESNNIWVFFLSWFDHLLPNFLG